MIQIDLMKIEEIKKYYHWLSRLIDTFESEEIFDFVPIEEENKEY